MCPGKGGPGHAQQTPTWAQDICLFLFAQCGVHWIKWALLGFAFLHRTHRHPKGPGHALESGVLAQRIEMGPTPNSSKAGIAQGSKLKSWQLRPLPPVSPTTTHTHTHTHTHSILPNVGMCQPATSWLVQEALTQPVWEGNQEQLHLLEARRLTVTGTAHATPST